MQCLVEKRLTFSDVSTTIAKTGRLVLPRSHMQGNISAFLHHGCSPGSNGSTTDTTNSKSPSAAAALSMSLRLAVSITMYDSAGTAWPMVLKTWQNQVRGEHRPTFVLENSAPFFKFHGIVQGDSVRICAKTDTTPNGGGDRLCMGRSTDLPAPPPQAPPRQPIHTVSQSRGQPVVGFDVVGKVRKTGGGRGERGWNNNGSSYHHNHHQGIFYPEGNEADGAARALMDLMKHGVLPSGDGDGIAACGDLPTITTTTAAAAATAAGYHEQRMSVPSKPPFLTAFASKPTIIQLPQQKQQRQLLPSSDTEPSFRIINYNKYNNSTMVTTGDNWGSVTADIGGLVHQRIFTDAAAISVNYSDSNKSKYPYETNSPRDCLLPWRSRSSTPADGDDHCIKMMQSMMMNNGGSDSGSDNGGGKQQQQQQQQQRHVLMKPVARKGGMYVVTTGVSGPVGVVAPRQQQQ